MIPVVLMAVLVSSNLELGGAGGVGRIFGEPAVSEGRDASVADPVRVMWSGSAWVGLQWMRGHHIVLRFDHSSGSGSLGKHADLGEDLEETLTLDVYGLEYLRSLPRNGFRIKLGGGLGYASASDRLETETEAVSARGDGIAVWARSGIELPLVAGLFWNLDGVGQWTSFAAMKATGLEPYKTAFPVLRLETGLSIGL